VIAAPSVKGTGDFATRPKKILAFSDYDRENAWTDAEGLLHLKLAQRDGRWTSAEVVLTRALGYGTYVFTA
jgi:hypothetical protein